MFSKIVNTAKESATATIKQEASAKVPTIPAVPKLPEIPEKKGLFSKAKEKIPKADSGKISKEESQEMENRAYAVMANITKKAVAYETAMLWGVAQFENYLTKKEGPYECPHRLIFEESKDTGRLVSVVDEGYVVCRIKDNAMIPALMCLNCPQVNTELSKMEHKNMNSIQKRMFIGRVLPSIIGVSNSEIGCQTEDIPTEAVEEAKTEESVPAVTGESAEVEALKQQLKAQDDKMNLLLEMMSKQQNNG